MLCGCIFINLLSSCSEPVANSGITDRISDTVKQYCFYNSDSYWIYENSKSEIDTVTVVKDTSYFYFDDEEGRTVEKSLMTITSSLHPQRQKIWNFGNVYYFGLSGVSMISEYFEDDIFNPVESFFNYNEPMEDSVGSSVSIVNNRNVTYNYNYHIFDSDGTVYKDVRQYEHSKPSSENKKYIFWSKNIGPIRYVTHDGEEWNLTKYEVNQN